MITACRLSQLFYSLPINQLSAASVRVSVADVVNTARRTWARQTDSRSREAQTHQTNKQCLVMTITKTVFSGQPVLCYSVFDDFPYEAVMPYYIGGAVTKVIDIEAEIYRVRISESALTQITFITTTTTTTTTTGTGTGTATATTTTTTTTTGTATTIIIIIIIIIIIDEKRSGYNMSLFSNTSSYN